MTESSVKLPEVGSPLTVGTEECTLGAFCQVNTSTGAQEMHVLTFVSSGETSSDVFLTEHKERRVAGSETGKISSKSSGKPNLFHVDSWISAISVDGQFTNRVRGSRAIDIAQTSGRCKLTPFNGNYTSLIGKEVQSSQRRGVRYGNIIGYLEQHEILLIAGREGTSSVPLTNGSSLGALVTSVSKGAEVDAYGIITGDLQSCSVRGTRYEAVTKARPLLGALQKLSAECFSGQEVVMCSN